MTTAYAKGTYRECILISSIHHNAHQLTGPLGQIWLAEVEAHQVMLRLQATSPRALIDRNFVPVRIEKVKADQVIACVLVHSLAVWMAASWSSFHR